MALRPRILVRKVKQSIAMKTAMRASLEDRSSTARLTQATFSPSIFSTAESVAEALSSLDEDFFDALGMIAWPATEEPVEGDAVIFHDFCAAGLIPPFSEFFMAVLETYGLQMLHLHPNAVVILSFSLMHVKHMLEWRRRSRFSITSSFPTWVDPDGFRDA